MVKRLSSTDQNDSPLVNVPTPVSSGDAVNKSYADTKASASSVSNVDNTSNATERAATASLTNKDLSSTTNTFPVSTWTTPTLAGAWVDFGGTYLNRRHTKDVLGYVHIEGMVKTGTGTIFTLPVGSRPSATLSFSGTGNNAAARIDVNSAGVVSLESGSASSFLSLSGIVFYAA